MDKGWLCEEEKTGTACSTLGECSSQEASSQNKTKQKRARTTPLYFKNTEYNCIFTEPNNVKTTQSIPTALSHKR